MKKSMLILTGVAVLAAGVYSGSYLFAQQGGAGAQASAGTRVAVINVGHVFHKYKRALLFKAEIDDFLAKPKAEAKRIYQEMEALQGDLRKPGLDPREKSQIEAAIKTKKRSLEDMDADIRKVLSQRQEENLKTLWREINMGIESVAQAYGFQIVLGYGDPTDKKETELFGNIQRKMQAMDLGPTVPLYVHGSVDLSHAVTETLNRWYEKSAAPARPVSNSK